jgi:hypothetical protein
MCTYLSSTSSLADRTYRKIRIGQNQTGAKNEVLFISMRFVEPNWIIGFERGQDLAGHHKLIKLSRQNFTKQNVNLWLLLGLFLDRIRTQIMIVIYEKNFQIFESDRKKLHMDIN